MPTPQNAPDHMTAADLVAAIAAANIQENIERLRARRAEIEARRDELVNQHPALKAVGK